MSASRFQFLPVLVHALDHDFQHRFGAGLLAQHPVPYSSFSPCFWRGSKWQTRKRGAASFSSSSCLTACPISSAGIPRPSGCSVSAAGLSDFDFYALPAAAFVPPEAEPLSLTLIDCFTSSPALSVYGQGSTSDARRS